VKRLLLLVGLGLLVVALFGAPLLSDSFRASYRCLHRNRHNPVRHPLGGFVCADCLAPLADMEEAGLGAGYVPTQRRLYDRRHGALTRTSSWEPEVPAPDRPGRDPGFYRPGVRRRTDRALPRRAM
jgi:hypothetical protein